MRNACRGSTIFSWKVCCRRWIRRVVKRNFQESSSDVSSTLASGISRSRGETESEWEISQWWGGLLGPWGGMSWMALRGRGSWWWSCENIAMEAFVLYDAKPSIVLYTNSHSLSWVLSRLAVGTERDPERNEIKAMAVETLDEWTGGGGTCAGTKLEISMNITSITMYSGRTVHKK